MKLPLVFAVVLFPSVLLADNLFTNSDMEKSSGWRGDKSYKKLGDLSVLELKANPDRMVSFHQDANTRGVKDVLLKLRYMTSDYSGRGFQIRGERVGGGATFNNFSLQADGKWHEITWNFSEVRDNRSLLFFFNLLEGQGTVYFDDIVAEKP